jgi:hypothetical protein
MAISPGCYGGVIISPEGTVKKQMEWRGAWEFSQAPRVVELSCQWVGEGYLRNSVRKIVNLLLFDFISYDWDSLISVLDFVPVTAVASFNEISAMPRKAIVRLVDRATEAAAIVERVPLPSGS